MGHLTRGDIAALMECAREMQAVSGQRDYPLRMIAALIKLIPSDSATFGLIDVARKTASFFPSPFDSFPDVMNVEFPSINHQHPATRPLLVNSGLSVIAELPPVQDAFYRAVAAGRVVNTLAALSKRDYRRLPLYNEVYRKNRREYEVGFHLKIGTGNSVSTGITREKGDFTTREMEMYQLLTPHIRAGYDNFVRTFGDPGAAPGTPIWLDADNMITLLPDRRIGHASEKARNSLYRYFSHSPLANTLPAELDVWLIKQADNFNDGSFLGSNQQDYTVSSVQGQLTVRIGPISPNGETVLYLEEQLSARTIMAPHHFAVREMEVLRLVTAGKSNKEIAHRMNISYFTVRWYLREIFAKLGVANRAAAVTEFHRLLAGK